MTFHGRIQNGKVVLDEPVALPDGTTVQVHVVRPEATEASPDVLPTHYEILKDVIGTIEGLPPDFAINHDHYIHGTERRVKLE